MGKHSNLLLVQNDKIIDTHKKMFFETGRQLIPGATFEHFPTDKKPFDHIDFTVIEYPKMISNMYMGISLKLATYLYEKQIQIKEIKVKPTKDLDKPNGYWTDIFAIDHKKKYYETLSELLDDQETKNVQFKQSYQLFVDKQLKKYMRKKASLDQSLIDSTKKLEDRRYGDLIYQSGINLSEKRSSITVYDTDIELDATLTLNENAQKYYKAYQKAKRGVAFIKEQLDETKSLIELFESFNTYLEISNEADIKDLENDLMPYGYKAKKQKPSKKKQTIPNIVKIEDLDAVYLVGKNHLQNAYVTHELARSTDFFFHVKDAPGSHVVVQTESLNEPIIRKASMLAAYFSSLRHSSSIPVDYTSMKYVKKIPKVPGYKVMIKNQKTMFIDIDEDLIKTYL
jgi:predicted ribosome quality control (RQC) complex YloA/Tae2 family protein